MLDRSRPAVVPAVERAAAILVDVLAGGGTVYAVGNGGSAADAQHFASELVGRLDHDRRGWPAVALTTDTSALTSIANDFGFEQVFARQLRALARPGDAVLVLTTSGRSPNVIAAAEAALDLSCRVIAFVGEAGGVLAGLSDAEVSVQSTNAARVQEVHTVCLHALVALVQQGLLGDGPAVVA